MGERLSWLKNKAERPKEIVSGTSNGLIRVGKLVCCGLMLGVGINALNSSRNS